MKIVILLFQLIVFGRFKLVAIIGTTLRCFLHDVCPLVFTVNLRNERSAQSSYFERMFRQHLQSASVRTNEVQQPATPASQPQAGVPVDNTSKPPSLTNGYYFPPPVAKIVDDSPRESGVMATSHRFSQPAITIQGNVLASENSNKPGYVTPGAYFSRSSTIGAMANGVHSPEPRTMNRDEFKQTVIAEEKSKKNMVVATEAQCFPPAVISGQEQKEKLAEKSSDRPVHLASVSQCNGIHPVDQVTNARTVKPAAHLPTAEINQYPSIHDMEFGSTFRNGTSISVCVLDVMDPQGLYVTDKDFDQYSKWSAADLRWFSWMSEFAILQRKMFFIWQLNWKSV